MADLIPLFYQLIYFIMGKNLVTIFHCIAQQHTCLWKQLDLIIITHGKTVIEEDRKTSPLGVKIQFVLDIPIEMKMWNRNMVESNMIFKARSQPSEWEKEDKKICFLFYSSSYWPHPSWLKVLMKTSNFKIISYKD